MEHGVASLTEHRQVTVTLVSSPLVGAVMRVQPLSPVADLAPPVGAGLRTLAAFTPVEGAQVVVVGRRAALGSTFRQRREELVGSVGRDHEIALLRPRLPAGLAVRVPVSIVEQVVLDAEQPLVYAVGFSRSGVAEAGSDTAAPSGD